MKNLILALAIGFIAAPVMAGEIALTFDDAPRGNEQIYSGPQRAQKIIDVLKQHQIQAAFFVNTDKFPVAKGAERISAYAKAGHLIANHTHSHLRLRDTPIKLFTEDIDKADAVLRRFSTFRPWFRFPYLGEGPTLEVRDGVRNHLKQIGYKNGYVTVDNYDYFINDLVQAALKRGQKVSMEKACGMLIDLMWDGIKYYDEVAQKHIGSVRHVLLMHENDIEAYCLDSLIAHIKTRGWKIISPDLAFADPNLSIEPNTLYLGQGRVAAIAHAKSGIKYISDWETETSLKTEFIKRRIIEK